MLCKVSHQLSPRRLPRRRCPHRTGRRDLLGIPVPGQGDECDGQTAGASVASGNDTPLTPNNVRTTLKKVLALADIHGVSPRLFRRTVAAAIHANETLELAAELPGGDVTAATVLSAVLCHEGAEKSAHDTITVEQNIWAGIGPLAAEYETIAHTALKESLFGRARWNSDESRDLDGAGKQTVEAGVEGTHGISRPVLIEELRVLPLLDHHNGAGR